MSSQLVVSINSSADYFRWCWLGDDQAPVPGLVATAGDLDALRAALGDLGQQAWLLLPGAKVVTRSLEYTEKEKKHLRNLLPFQLEESVVGDIDDLHVAIGTASAGKVALAYTDKQWLKAIFTQLANIGIEITRCWAMPLVLPLGSSDEKGSQATGVLKSTETPEEQSNAGPKATWALGFENGQVNLRFAEQEGFSVPLPLLASALDMLIATQKLGDKLPHFALRATEQADLDMLYQSLPAHLAAQVSSATLADSWQLDFNGKAIDLCQAEFSQRLPLERWIKLWRGVGMLALVTFVVYVGVLGFNIHKLNKENLQLRQQMEAVYRTVVPSGQADDPEKRLRLKLQQLQPKTQSGSVVAILAGVFPIIAANPDVTVKVVSYSADSGEMSISVQAHSFNSIDALRQSISSQGYTAELLTANAQGDLNSGRLKITKPQQ
jgi:general secretion pathway protein L